MPTITAFNFHEFYEAITLEEASILEARRALMALDIFPESSTINGGVIFDHPIERERWLIEEREGGWIITPIHFKTLKGNGWRWQDAERDEEIKSDDDLQDFFDDLLMGMRYQQKMGH